jgi:hypothetical protein
VKPPPPWASWGRVECSHMLPVDVSPLERHRLRARAPDWRTGDRCRSVKPWHYWPKLPPPCGSRRRDTSKEPPLVAWNELERQHHLEDRPPPSSTPSIVSNKIRPVPTVFDGEHILEFPSIYSLRFGSHISL